MTTLLQRIPARDPASRHLLKHAQGSALFPGGALLSESAVDKRVKILESWTGNRTALAQWLETQNAFAPLHSAQNAHLKASAQSNALFLLTGQQPVLLGGPALWFCKAMTCIVSARISAQRLGHPVIPIFWVAGDDSDLAECAAVEWLEPKADAAGFKMDFPDADASIPMSLRALPESGLNDLFQSLKVFWNEETLSLARKCYQPGRTLTQAFLHLAQTLLGSEGILFVDGLSAAKHGAPFLVRLARQGQDFQKNLWQGTRRLADTLALPPQVTPRGGTLPLFMLEQGKRVRLHASDGDGGKSKARIFVQGKESRDLSGELERLDLLPAALSRPMMAETIFPVLGHILGPAELRYFAQISDVFPAFGLSFPPVQPRQQAMLCSKQDWKRLAELGLRPEDLPEFSPSKLRSRISARLWNGDKAAEEFPDQAFLAFTAQMRNYRDRFFPASADMEGAGRRFEKGFDGYREAARRALFARQGAETYASFRPLLRWLGNGSQDRHLNLLSLRNILCAAGFSEWTELLREETPGIVLAVYGEEI